MYDVSGGRYKLFSIPVPDGAKGLVKGITGQSPARTFEPGTHFLSVTAQNAMGIESETNAAKITVEVKRKEWYKAWQVWRPRQCQCQPLRK